MFHLMVFNKNSESVQKSLVFKNCTDRKEPKQKISCGSAGAASGPVWQGTSYFEEYNAKLVVKLKNVFFFDKPFSVADIFYFIL